MIVYRLIKYEGPEDVIQGQLQKSIDGVYQPNSQITITACHLKGGLSALSSDSARKQLEEAGARRWQPESPTAFAMANGSRLPTRVAVGYVPSPIITRGAALHGQILGFPGSEAVEFVQHIDDLLAEEGSRGPRYEWAADTLNGIRETVLKKGFVTEAQKTAVDNIEHARR